jgi:hypothetical protein
MSTTAGTSATPGKQVTAGIPGTTEHGKKQGRQQQKTQQNHQGQQQK